MHWIVNYAFDHVLIEQMPDIYDCNNIPVKCQYQILNIVIFKNAVYFSWW